MYARVARFSGTSGEDRRERAERLRSEIEAVGSGAVPDGVPEQAASVLRDNVVRVLALAGAGDEELSLVFTETEEGMRAVHAVLEGMTPPGGDGHRTAVETYEVLFDTAPA